AIAARSYTAKVDRASRLAIQGRCKRDACATFAFRTSPQQREPLRCVSTTPKRLCCGLANGGGASDRLITLHSKTFCCERAIIFEEEVSIYIIETPRVRARVTLAVATYPG